MKFLSLFTGIGGFDLALQRAGMKCVGQVEIDRACLKLLSRRFPGVKQIEDVKNVTKENAGSADLICGGFPCQDLSIAGKRAGLAGSRSGLWYEFARIIDDVEPTWVIIENVPGLLSSNRGKDFAVIIRWLAKRGYGVVWRVLDAQYFGLAQRRKRVFIVASFGDGRAAEVLFEREGGARDTPPSRKAGEGVAPSLNGIANRTGGSRPPGTTLDTAESLVAPTLRSLNNQGAGRMVDDVQIIGWNAAQITSKLNTGGVFMKSTSTLNGDSRAMAGVRRLTPTECERLQGFPDGWTAGQSDSVRYRQLGNAVAVPVVEWIARRIAAL